jgi:hypothetical protein
MCYHNKHQISISKLYSDQQPSSDLDRYARSVEAIWKQLPAGSLLPGMGLPSQGAGVATYTHQMSHPLKPMIINGLASKSALANNALYSFEITGNKWLNLYEVMLSDIPGHNGNRSSNQRFIQMLSDQGLQVAGVHFHWFGTVPMTAIHIQDATMDPQTFSTKMVQVLKNFVNIM